jgi:apolipoprotein N-acyltransferase
VTFARIADPIIAAKGYTRALIAFLAGAASTLGLAPTNLWPALFVTFPILVWLIDGATFADWEKPPATTPVDDPLPARARATIDEIKKNIGIAAPPQPSQLTRAWRHIAPAAGIGWWFGFGYFVAGLYWLGFALLVDAQSYAWFLPFAIIGVPAGLAIFTSFGVVLARLVWTRGAWRVLTLAAGLTIAEWLRGHVLTGFPWNTYGYALTGSLWLAQASALVGIWMLTLIAVAVFASPATLGDSDESLLGRALLPIGAAAVLVGFAIFGDLRLAETPTHFVDGVELRVMQPNLPEDATFNYSARDEVMQRYVALSRRVTAQRPNGIAGVTHLVWPESAFPFFLAYEGKALSDIVNLLPSRAVLITGAVRAAQPDPDGHLRHAYNSIYVLDHDVSVRGLYDKVHLVPFGEYLPFQDFMESLGLLQLTKIRGGYIAGGAHKTLAVPGAPPALPLVCYEIIFPEEARAYVGDRPAWIINLTNDGWFGLSSGPYQHFQQARVRAIELGLPLVRAANTGISAVVDPLGRVIASLPLGVDGVLDARLPQPVPPTVYTRIGDSPMFAALIGIFAIAYFVRRRAPSLKEG